MRAKFPLDQTFRVRGKVKVPIHKTLRVPIKQTIHPKLDAELDAQVRLGGAMPAQLAGEFTADVQVDEVIRAHMGAMHLDADQITFEMR